MKRITLSLCVLLAVPATALAKPAPKRLLFFTRSAGFEHSTVKANKDEQPFALGVLSALAMPHNWEVVHTKDGGVFTPQMLAGFDAFVFLTTGDLTQPRKDKDQKPLPPEDPNQLPMTAEGKAALLAAVAAGKGFVGIHNASDTFHSAGQRGSHQEPAETDPFIAMLGGEFIAHGEQQMASVRVVDPRFPGFGNIDRILAYKEEWYTLKNQPQDMHALLVLDPGGMTGGMYDRPPYPVAWSRKHGKGKVFYTALGHREDVWTHAAFQKMLVGGIKFVLGAAPGSIKPNVTQVAPLYRKLPDKP